MAFIHMDIPSTTVLDSSVYSEDKIVLIDFRGLCLKAHEWTGPTKKHKVEQRALALFGTEQRNSK